MRRGEVWWANLPPPSGRRPVLLISRDEAYAVRDLVIVSPVTMQMRGIRTEVRLGPEEGLPRPSVANLDIIITVSKRSLQERIASLSPAKLRTMEEAIHFALGLET